MKYKFYTQNTRELKKHSEHSALSGAETQLTVSEKNPAWRIGYGAGGNAPITCRQTQAWEAPNRDEEPTNTQSQK